MKKKDGEEGVQGGGGIEGKGGMSSRGSTQGSGGGGQETSKFITC